jgi:tRNA pseudouridine55 synthase
MAVPKALEPTGIVLVDKPAGPSSFAMVAQVRRRTGARTGHSGTLDPFASGLLILLSGRATRHQDRFMRLDKRYVTDVDLRCTTGTGDPEGERSAEHEPPDRAALERRLSELRGEVELTIPAASAVKIDGERAYHLHRKGVVVEMPKRLMRVHALDLVDLADGIARLELHVGSGTYVRAIAEAVGGHCVTLRRTSIGPFDVAEADPLRIVPLEEALALLPEPREHEAA